VRTTISGSIAFDIDTSNIQYFDAQAPFNETAQLLFKITMTNGSQASGVSNIDNPGFGELFPNPVSAYTPLFIEFPDSHYSNTLKEVNCWDLYGRLIAHYRDPSGPGVLQLQGLPPGKYIVQIKVGDAMQNTWLVVE
jgi:hypothetical protein